MFKTIVVGVDGREGGRDALSLASRLALAAGGQLVAVRAVLFDHYVSRAGSPPYSSLARVTRIESSRARSPRRTSPPASACWAIRRPLARCTGWRRRSTPT
jgi:nucleotide-binding universal stress UspA family protein